MAYPTIDTSHVAEGLALLTSRFRNLPNIRGVLTSYLNRVQDLENVIWQVIAAQQLAQAPTGQSLTQLADLLAEARGTFTDAQLLVWIKVIARALRSAGLSEDIIQVCSLALGPGVASYFDTGPAAFNVFAANINGDYAYPLASALHVARPPSVLAVLEWSDFSPAQNIVLQDSVGHELDGFSGLLGSPTSMPGLFEPGFLPGNFNPPPAQGLADSVSGQYPFKVMGAIQL